MPCLSDIISWDVQSNTWSCWRNIALTSSTDLLCWVAVDSLPAFSNSRASFRFSLPLRAGIGGKYMTCSLANPSRELAWKGIVYLGMQLIHRPTKTKIKYVSWKHDESEKVFILIRHPPKVAYYSAAVRAQRQTVGSVLQLPVWLIHGLASFIFARNIDG